MSGEDERASRVANLVPINMPASNAATTEIPTISRDRVFRGGGYELRARAIDEGLRWECPLTGISRTSAEDTTVCGVSIPKEAGIVVNLGSANHDAARFEEPRRFDIRRANARQHLAFAFGPHRCLGQHLALMETRVLLERMFERLPNLRLDPEHEAPRIEGRMFHSPATVRVLFDPDG